MLGSNKVSAVVDEDEAADDFERDSSIICEVTGFPFPEELLMHNELKCGKNPFWWDNALIVSKAGDLK